VAQQHLDPTNRLAERAEPARPAGPVPAEALACYLRAQATEFLRALRLHRESGTGANGSSG
jgi:hypothetical protein